MEHPSQIFAAVTTIIRSLIPFSENHSATLADIDVTGEGLTEEGAAILLSTVMGESRGHGSLRVGRAFIANSAWMVKGYFAVS
jgi:hypothetical protein